MGEGELAPFLQAAAEAEEKVRQERKGQQELLLNCRMQLEEFKSTSSRRFKEIVKVHEGKMLVLRQKLKEIERTYAEKISFLK